MATWEDTLQVFIDRSNENQRVGEHFETVILPQLLEDLQAVDGRYDWLDVGPGDAQKTRILYSILSKPQYGLPEIRLTLLEPHQRWKDQLEKEFSSHVFPQAQVVGEDFRTYARLHGLDRFDLVTFVHVLYERMLAEEVFAYLKNCGPQKSPRFYMVMEDASSDVARIRQDLQKRGVPVPQSQFDFLVFGLQEHHIPHQVFDINGQRCCFNRQAVLENDEDWIFPFLLGCSLLEYSNLPPSQRSTILQVAREHILRLQGDFLSIDDKVILV